MALTESGVAGLSARVRAWLADSSDRSLTQRMASAAFLIRVASAALIYVSQILLARWLGGFEFGVYVYVWTWLVLLGSIAPLGFAYLPQRYIPEYAAAGDHGKVRGFVAGSRWLTFALGTAVALLGALALLALEGQVGPFYFIPLLLAFACIPVFAFGSTQESIARSYDWFDLALVPAYIAQPLAILAIMAVLYFSGAPMTAVTTMCAVAAAIWIMAIVQYVMVNRRLSQKLERQPRTYEVATWMRTAMPLLLVDGFFFLLTHVDILLLQLFVQPEQIAVYYAATKTLALVAFIYFAVAAACAHRFTEYHVAGDRERLASFVADATRWTFWPSLAVTLLLVALGKPILMLFGPNFEAGYPLILVLAVGLLARASIGPAERLLNMLGQQRMCALVYACAFAANLILCFVLIPRLGLMGAALATAIAILLETVLLALVSWRQLGLHVFIFGRARVAVTPA
jgi:O-antigen/teichoic acid export membrane protein